MSLEGLLTVVGLLIALYALAQPIQRRSIPLFVPMRIAGGLIFISIVISIWRYAVPIFGYELLPFADLFSMTSTFILPMIAIILSVGYWHRAKLNKRNSRYFERLISTSYQENQYDELMRILEKNEKHVSEVLEPETIELLFSRNFVSHMFRINNWIHMRLFSNKEIVEFLPNRYKVTDSIVRELLASRNTPFHLNIAAQYGGSEFIRFSEKANDLIESSFQDPDWYMSVRIDYALTVIVCCEILASKKLDELYNDCGEWYTSSQGESARIHCPIYFALKTHVILLKNSIMKEKEDDYYVSDLWDIFRDVLKHSKYSRNELESAKEIIDCQTPYTYLMQEIIFDLKDLCECRRIKVDVRTPGRIGDDLIRTWTNCAAAVSYSKSNLSEIVKMRLIEIYLVYILTLKESYERTSDVNRENNRLWCYKFIRELKRFTEGDERIKRVLAFAINNLDKGKGYYRYVQWFKSEIHIS